MKRKKYMPGGLKLFLMSLPFLAVVLAFSYVPLFGWAYAFMDYKPGMQWSSLNFTGLESFITIFANNRELLTVLRNTLVMSLLSIASSVLPMFFAILLNEMKSTRFRRLVQTMTTLPNFISWVIVFSLCFAIFSNDGMFNSVLELLNIPTPKINIMGNSGAVWAFQWALGTWKSLGWGAIVYIAAIAGIDTELFDAAQVDGANRFQVIRYITLPGLISTYIVLLLLGISNILNNGFEQYYVFYNPLVAEKIQVLDYYVYKVGLIMNDYPLSTAIGMTKTLISLLLLFIANFLSKKLRGNSII